MLHGRRDDITAEEVTQFVAQTRLPESAVLDYKRDYDLSNEKGKRAFLADLCAFANNGGGHIVIGIDEERGEDSEKTGLPVSPPSGAKLFDRSIAENILDDLIDPKIGSMVEIHEVDGGWEGSVYIVRIGRSWNPPHCVQGREGRKYFRRSGTKSDPMTTDQIRELFIRAADLGGRVAQFHHDRVQQIVGGGTTFPLQGDEGERGHVITHVVPLSFFASGDFLALVDDPGLRPQWRCGRHPMVPNFDGWVSYAGEAGADTHVQVFRNGAVEIVEAGIAKTHNHRDVLRQNQVECHVIHAVREALRLRDAFPDLLAPWSLHVTLDGVAGSIIPVTEIRWLRGIHAIELDHLRFPDLRLEEVAVSDLRTIVNTLRPIFDMLWPASGWPRSLNYDPETGSYDNGWCDLKLGE